MEIVKQEHKKQLHDRISERRVQLEGMLVELKADAHNAKSERARAVEEALAALTTHLAGGWDSIDESESAALSRWLETSRFLFDAPTATTPTRPIPLKMPAPQTSPPPSLSETQAPPPSVPNAEPAGKEGEAQS